MADEEKDECPPCLQHVPLWMVTFADMASLLMAFFVLLTILIPRGKSQSSPTEQEMIESFQKSFSGQVAGGNTFSTGSLMNMGFNFNKLPSSRRNVKDQSELLGKIRELLSNEIRSRKVTIQQTRDGFSISLIGDLYFEPGKAKLEPEATPILKKIGDLVFDLQKSNVDNAIRIKGFADASLVKPDSRLYRNNLDLTSARADSVIEFFWNYGISPTRVYGGQTLAKFQAVGYGEFQPLERNVTPEERAYNRRVEIEFLNDPDSK